MDYNKIMDMWNEVLGMFPLRQEAMEVVNSLNMIQTEDTYDWVLALRMLLPDFLKAVQLSIYDIVYDNAEYTRKIARIDSLLYLLEDKRIKEYQESISLGLEELRNAYNVEKSLSDTEEAFIYMNAKRNINNLRVDVFRRGEKGKGKYIYSSLIHAFDNINNLLVAVMNNDSFNGVTLNCIIDKDNTAYSYFCFIIKDGENVIMVSDRSLDLTCTKNNTRSPGRNMERRIGTNWFPYELLNLEIGKGYARFNSSLPTADDIYVIGNVSDCGKEASLWVPCCLQMLYKKYIVDMDYGEAADKEISYTGGMVDVPLITGGQSNNFYAPVLSENGYACIKAERLTFEDVSAYRDCYDNMFERFGFNNWLMDRYKDAIQEDTLNIEGKSYIVVNYRNFVYPKKETTGFDRNYIGSRKQVEDERYRAARNAMAEQIDMLYEKEVSKSLSGLYTWYEKKLDERKDFLAEAVGRKECILPCRYYEKFVSEDAKQKYLAGGKMKDNDFQTFSKSFGTIRDENCLEVSENLEWDRFKTTLSQKMSGRSYFTDKPSSYSYIIRINCPEAIAAVLGMEVKDLPELLQHYTPISSVGYGNNILNNLDPIEHIRNHIWQFRATIRIFVSKSEVKAFEKQYGR